MFSVEGLVSNQRHDPPWRPHNDVRAVVLDHLLVLLDTDPTKEHGDLDIVKIFAESLVFLVDLECQLSMRVRECQFFLVLIC